MGGYIYFCMVLNLKCVVLGSESLATQTNHQKHALNGLIAFKKNQKKLYYIVFRLLNWFPHCKILRYYRNM